MRARCANPTNPRYGAAGITVCSRWLRGGYGISGFALSKTSPDPHWIERVEPTQGYFAANCRWTRSVVIERVGHRIHE